MLARDVEEENINRGVPLIMKKKVGSAAYCLPTSKLELTHAISDTSLHLPLQINKIKPFIYVLKPVSVPKKFSSIYCAFKMHFILGLSLYYVLISTVKNQWFINRNAGL